MFKCYVVDSELTSSEHLSPRIAQFLATGLLVSLHTVHFQIKLAIFSLNSKASSALQFSYLKNRKILH